MSRWYWILSEMAGRLWVRASLYGVVAVATVLGAIYFKRFIPEEFSQRIGADAVDGILNIMAASMLSVTIFSVSAMVAAYGAATSNVTPRATRLLIEDKISHKALSTFIGAFIFSLVGITALKTGVYGESGRLILFIVTIGVLVMIIVTLLRWIEYLGRLGRVNETIERVEEAATRALEGRLSNPYLGGVPINKDDALPADMKPVHAGLVGYVQHIDMGRLSHIAVHHDLTVYIHAPPGKFVDEYYPLAMISGPIDAEIAAELRRAFIMDEERSFRQDPRYGVAVLCEIGTRALSSAINDTGTPIFILGVGVRVLSIWAKRKEMAPADDKPAYPRIHVPPLRIEDLFDDFFPALARDGAGTLEVQIRLQKAYAALARTGDEELRRAAIRHSANSMRRAEMALSLDVDKARLRAIAATVDDAAQRDIPAQ